MHLIASDCKFIAKHIQDNEDDIAVEDRWRTFLKRDMGKAIRKMDALEKALGGQMERALDDIGMLKASSERMLAFQQKAGATQKRLDRSLHQRMHGSSVGSPLWAGAPTAAMVSATSGHGGTSAADTPARRPTALESSPAKTSSHGFFAESPSASKPRATPTKSASKSVLGAAHAEQSAASKTLMGSAHAEQMERLQSLKESINVDLLVRIEQKLDKLDSSQARLDRKLESQLRSRHPEPAEDEARLQAVLSQQTASFETMMQRVSALEEKVTDLSTPKNWGL